MKNHITPRLIHKTRYMKNSTFSKKAGMMAVLLFSICFGASALQNVNSNLSGKFSGNIENNKNIGCNNFNCFGEINFRQVDFSFSFHISNFKNSIARKPLKLCGEDLTPLYAHGINCENANPTYLFHNISKTNGMENSTSSTNCQVGLFSFIGNTTNHNSKTR